MTRSRPENWRPSWAAPRSRSSDPIRTWICSSPTSTRWRTRLSATSSAKAFLREIRSTPWP
ncbi:MAG: autoinducer binding domain-containing protein [Lachnospiraceae bacterium]|nr:autoinducer binding domain-containing protein [Lachnospiraceae bacterium]